jgi:serine protease Do
MKNRLLLIYILLLIDSPIYSQTPPKAESLLKKAYNYRIKGKNDQALGVYEDLLKRWSTYDSNYPLICLEAGYCAYDIGQYAKAKEFLADALYYGKFDQNKKDEILGYLATSHSIDGDFEGAEKIFVDAIKERTQISKILRDYIYFYVDSSGTKLNSQSFINILLQLADKTSDPSELCKIYLRLGNFYDSLGMLNEAKDYYEKTVAILPSFIPYFKLGSIYFSLGTDYLKSAMLIDSKLKDSQIKKDNLFIISDRCFSYSIFNLEQAFLMNPQDTLIKRHLSEKYKILKESEKLVYLNNNTLYSILKSSLMLNQLNYSKRIGDQSSNLVDLFYKTKDAIVRIEVKRNDGKVSQGSGFIITQDGICVSNFHVFSGSSFNEATIYIGSKKYQIEKIVEVNNTQDYVIFKISNIYSNTITKISPTLPKIGEEVYAIGNPFGLENTLSKGIISGYRANNELLQTTADITFGSSGGALFNLKGEVIGITSSGFSQGNINFAINVQSLKLKRFTNQ